jgi:hypothetical protein
LKKTGNPYHLLLLEEMTTVMELSRTFQGGPFAHIASHPESCSETGERQRRVEI